jgi:hypothetical protein
MWEMRDVDWRQGLWKLALEHVQSYKVKKMIHSSNFNFRVKGQKKRRIGLKMKVLQLF